jgi:hypothetical protein
MKATISRIIGIILIIGGLVLTFLVTKDLLHDLPIWFNGSLARAVIVEQSYDEYDDEDWHEYIDEFDVFSVYYLTYQFTTSTGEVITGTSKTPGEQWAYLSPGKEILIRYSNSDPTNNRLDDSPYVPFLLCAYIPFFILCAFVLVAGKEMLDF